VPATVISLPGNAGPVNAGEESVLGYLAATLPTSYALIPNITIPYARSTPEEYDIIAVGPDAVFVIEVKTLAGEVEVSEQEMLVDGDVRGNPYNTSRVKAQKLSSKLELTFGKTEKVWVEHVVVLSRRPRRLVGIEQFHDRIFVGADEVLPALLPPSRLINRKGHGLHATRRDQIVAAITGGASVRERRPVFNEYDGKKRLLEAKSPGGFEYWEAEHRLHGGARLLQVFPSEGAQRNQHDTKRFEAQRRVEAAESIGPSADIIAPRENFETSSGDYVLVWPVVDSPSLQKRIEELTVDADSGGKKRFSDAEARSMVEGFARAYSDAHRSGFVFGKMQPSAFVVRPNGRGAVVLQYPVPVKSLEQRQDLEQLREIANSIVANSEPGICSEVVGRFGAGLESNINAEIPSAGWLAASCQTGLAQQVPELKLGDYFDELKELASHAYGKTYRGVSKRLKRPVAVRVEKGRPGQGWVAREALTLTRPEAATNGVVRHLQEGVVAEGAYVATEWLDGVPLTAMLDAGTFSDPGAAIDATIQLLEVLKQIHPDLSRLDAVLGTLTGELGPDQLREVESIRSVGFAHNQLEPSNIIWVERRGPVLIDFARAAEFGREIPLRLSPYWPVDAPRTQSNPQADLYAIGLILLVMLTGPLNRQRADDTIELRIQGLAKKNPSLAELVSRATSVSAEERFRSAIEFIDALVALQIGATQAERALPDLEVYRRIEALTAQGKFDEALAICTERNWLEAAANIERKKHLASDQGRELVSVDGVTVSYLGTREVGPGTTGSNGEYKRGLAYVYLAKLDQGGVLEFHTVSAHPIDSDSGEELPIEETWVQGDLEFGLPEHVQMLADRRRLVVMPLTSDGRAVREDEASSKSLKPTDGRYCHIRQLQLSSAEKVGSQWKATNKKISEDQLRKGAGGVDVAALLQSFGAVDFGTREKVIQDTSKMRGDLCVKFDRSAIHVPAVTFLICRLLPLKNKVVATQGGE
jgi:hypothetical protein